jgi:hypothetical protein
MGYLHTASNEWVQSRMRESVAFDRPWVKVTLNKTPREPASTDERDVPVGVLDMG